jgi:hypothetical protein
MTEFTLPIPEVPTLPYDIKIDTSHIPQVIDVNWGTPPNAKGYLDDQATPRADIVKTKKNLFTVESEVFDMMPYVRGVKYKYQPKQIFLVLYDSCPPDQQSPVFKYMHDMTTHRIGDTLTVTNCDTNGNMLYEHKFLGCELIDHECPMSWGSGDLKHRLVFRYFSMQFKQF